MTHERERKKRRPEPSPLPKEREEELELSPAKPFNRKKLILQLLTVAAVVLAIAIGISIFFKVDTVSISGLDRYTYETVLDASGIREGDSLLFFSRAEVSSRIKALDYVKSVRIGVTLPGTVHIVIEETTVFYSVQDTVGAWWLISAEGRVLENADAVTANSHTVIRGVTLLAPEVGQQAVASEAAREPDVPVTVTGADRLAAALAVAQALEENELLGEFSAMDVSSLYDLQLWHGTDYRFVLGDNSELITKAAYLKGALRKILDDYPPGTLDLSDPEAEGKFPYRES